MKAPRQIKHYKNLAGSLLMLALLSAISPALHADEGLGRLFFTPERRQNLDRQRQLNIQDKQEIPEDPTLTINGIVTRNSGKRTAWINGVAQNENETQSGISVISSRKDPGSITVQANDAPSAKARVGDTVNRNTGETMNLLGEGQIKVRPAPYLAR